MTEEKVTLSHGRLKTRFAALGPYLREKKSSPDCYFFDSLSACINAKKAPEHREFWGWWMQLYPVDTGFEYLYGFGKFNDASEWVDESIPDKVKKEVEETLHSFYDKLSGLLEKDLQTPIQAATSLKEEKLGSAA